MKTPSSPAKTERKKNIAGRVRESIAPLIEQAGYTLWDVTFYKEASEFILEVSIDRDGGISTDDCAVVTRLIDPVIDALDPIEESYCLEVSSTGNPRELRCPQHYEYARSRRLPVILRTFAAIEGKKQFEGLLCRYDEDTVSISENGTERRFDKKQIAKLSALCEEVTDESLT